LSLLLKRLERAGLITRRRRYDDERVVEVSPTEPGWAVRSRASGIPARMAEATGMTPPEIAALRDTLEVLIMRLRAAELRLGPPPR